MTGPNEELTHLVYEASLDNSLWPELVLELTEQLEVARKTLPSTAELSSIDNLSAHFRRAFSISERIVGLQERESDLNAVLNAFSFGVALIDEKGAAFVRNRALDLRAEATRLFEPHTQILLQCPDTQTEQTLKSWVTQVNKTDRPSPLMLGGGAELALLLLPRREAVRMGFPAKAAAVLLCSEASETDGLRAFAARHGLSRREVDLLGSVMTEGDLKRAAAAINLSYESARTYLKRIYDKTGLHSQIDLVQTVQREPLNILRRRQTSDEERYRVRRLMTLSDGRQLEYFTLGPADGTSVVHFDALAGITIDMIGNPSGVLAHLERHNIRLITPCRPGGFRSSPRHMTSLRDFASDVRELLDHLKVDRFSICAVSFGAGSALAITHEMQDRIDRVVLSAAPNPGYTPPDWRELDLFYQMSGVLGRKWPSMLRQMLPFLIRSIMQNVDRYFDRYISKTKSAHDVTCLSSPFIRKRMAQMLAERTAAGMDGMVEENVLNVQGWDFDVADIAVPVEIHHGEVDNVAPIAGARLLAQSLPHAVLQAYPHRGHYHHITEWPWMLARSAGRSVEPGGDIYDIPGI